MNEIRRIFAVLHYDLKWQECGLLDEQFFKDQFTAYQTGDDQHTEHYRYKAFQAILATRDTLDEQTLNTYIELAQLDEDRTMGGSALGRLIRWPHLTDTQLERLAAHPAYQETFLQKLIQRVTMLRELRTAELTDEAFARFLASGDNEVHRSLLQKVGLTEAYLSVLQSQGANKAIRNLARRQYERLKR